MFLSSILRNTIIGTIIAVFLIPYYSVSFLSMFIVSQTISQIVGLSAVFFRFLIIRMIHPKNMVNMILVILINGLLASLASFIAFFLIGFITQGGIFSSINDFFIKVSVPAFFIVITMGSIRMFIDNHLLKSGSKNENEAPSKIDARQNNKSQVLSFRSSGEYVMAPYSDILYFTANKMKTIVHTKDEDFTADHILKDILQKLPEDMFARVHKKFVVNLSTIQRIQYLAGGSYIAYLNDEDDTQIVVGRSYASSLKTRLNIT